MAGGLRAWKKQLPRSTLLNSTVGFSFFLKKRYAEGGNYFMPMTTLLEKAFQEASKLPEEEQDNVAEIIISFIHPDEAEWDAVVRGPQSQRFLDQMVRKLKEEERKDGLLPFPGDR